MAQLSAAPPESSGSAAATLSASTGLMLPRAPSYCYILQPDPILGKSFSSCPAEEVLHLASSDPEDSQSLEFILTNKVQLWLLHTYLSWFTKKGTNPE